MMFIVAEWCLRQRQPVEILFAKDRQLVRSPAATDAVVNGAALRVLAFFGTR